MIKLCLAELKNQVYAALLSVQEFIFVETVRRVLPSLYVPYWPEYKTKFFALK